MTTKLASEFDDTYTLVTNSQDIEEVISYTGTTIEPNYPRVYQSLLVSQSTINRPGNTGHSTRSVRT
jgi:aromatic ring-opening dioxygenase LigB subunit